MDRQAYTVGWICAVQTEYVAACELLDEDHPLPSSVSSHDSNAYTLGRIGDHYVVVACLPKGRYGIASAATVAKDMLRSFESIRIGLMVGIGGGAPSKKHDIRLGDVVVGCPVGRTGGILPYRYGKEVQGKEFEITGGLNSPPTVLLTALTRLDAFHERKGHQIAQNVRTMVERNPRIRDKYKYPGAEKDRLYEPTYTHINNAGGCDTGCKQTIPPVIQRQQRSTGPDDPVVHYGHIASADQLMKDAFTRDLICQQYDILCFEMEAAGLSNDFPCVVIRGICDYSDSHKNDEWQGYAAATAAAYAKELLQVLPRSQMAKSQRAAHGSEDFGAWSHFTDLPTTGHPVEQDVEMVETKPDLLQSGMRRKRKLSTEEPTDLALPVLSDDHRQYYMKALWFNAIGARYSTIKVAHTRTCKWLLQRQEYQDWLDANKVLDHHGLLWIKGKPGSGKSTLLKFVVTNTQKIKEAVVISFFFNARGEDLEKSTLGMYRSLLFQLLKNIPDLQGVLHHVRSVVPPNGGPYVWEEHDLQNLLATAIKKLKQQWVICFIDALDECEEDQVRDLVVFLEQIGQIAISSQTRLTICLSSRHYPHISMRKGLPITLEAQEGHVQDIARYLNSELKAGSGRQLEAIKEEIKIRASGIFLWVALVVQILNKEYDHGRIHALRKRLTEIPNGLDRLFEDILTRDQENMEELVLCLQWILHAKRPLKREELYYAVRSGIDHETLAVSSSETITPPDMERFILSCSKGLAETTRFKAQTVQFIHESVRDFLLGVNGFSKLRVYLESGQSHQRLVQCCRNYMKVDISGYLPSDTLLPLATSTEAKDLRVLISNELPFLEYAVRNVLYHADLADGHGISQVAFIESFALGHWILLDNLFEQYEVRRHTANASLLYILAEKSLSNLIRTQLKQESFPDTAGERIENERYKAPLYAALANAKVSEDTIRALLVPVVQPALDNRELQSAQPNDKIDCHRAAIKTIVKYQPSLNPRKGRSLLYWAASEGHVEVMQMLLEKGADVDAQGGAYGNALYVASTGGHEKVVQMLLEKGADVNAQRGPYGNALQVASTGGHEKVVQMLLEKGADVNALYMASAGGHEKVVQMLLEKGADVNAQGGAYINALYVASTGGHEKVVQMLLEKGADVNAQGGAYGNALQVASTGGHVKVVQMLLEKGADVNAQGGAYGNALQAALVGGHEAVVKLLLVRDDVDPNT